MCARNFGATFIWLYKESTTRNDKSKVFSYGTFIWANIFKIIDRVKKQHANLFSYRLNCTLESAINIQQIPTVLIFSTIQCAPFI